MRLPPSGEAAARVDGPRKRCSGREARTRMRVRAATAMDKRTRMRVGAAAAVGRRTDMRVKSVRRTRVRVRAATAAGTEFMHCLDSHAGQSANPDSHAGQSANRRARAQTGFTCGPQRLDAAAKRASSGPATPTSELSTTVQTPIKVSSTATSCERTRADLVSPPGFAVVAESRGVSRPELCHCPAGACAPRPVRAGLDRAGSPPQV
eukprot:4721327-Prymnesium_polylepis.2